jgi:hypothetical protein
MSYGEGVGKQELKWNILNNNGNLRKAEGIFADSANGSSGSIASLDIDSIDIQRWVNITTVISGTTVDVYIDGIKYVDDLRYRTATPFTNIPSGAIKITLTPGGSTSINDSVFNVNLNLNENSTLVAIANGLLSTTGYDIPMGRNVNFSIVPLLNAQSTAAISKTQLAIFHGATDAPAVSVRVSGTETFLTQNLNFGEFENYRELDATDANIDLLVASNNSIVNTYLAPLSALNGNSAVVFASGFLNPSANSNGPKGYAVPSFIPVSISFILEDISFRWDSYFGFSRFAANMISVAFVLSLN